MDRAIGVVAKNSAANQSPIFSPMLSSRGLVVLFLTCRPRIHFEFSFVEARGQRVDSFRHVAKSQVHVGSLLPWTAFAPFPNIS